MSDFERVSALLSEIGSETPGADDLGAWAYLEMRDNGGSEVTVVSALADEFQEQQDGNGLAVRHVSARRGNRVVTWASIKVSSRPAEDPIALLERALDFVRTETPVPL